MPSPEPSGRDEAVAVTQDLLIELIEMDDPVMASVAAAVVPRVEVLMQCNVVEAAAELEKELEATGGLGPDEALARKAIASATDLLVEFLEEFVGQMGGMQAQQQQLLYAISAASKESEAALDQVRSPSKAIPSHTHTDPPPPDTQHHPHAIPAPGP